MKVCLSIFPVIDEDFLRAIKNRRTFVPSMTAADIGIKIYEPPDNDYSQLTNET